MRCVYTDLGTVSIEYRYMDWIITVPLMALKFPSLVGKDAITDEKFLGLGFTGICFTGALIMIGFGYLGESGAISGMAGLILGGVGWAMIIVATGTPWSSARVSTTARSLMSFMWSTNALRWFICVGWIIYPLGYLFNPTADILPDAVDAEIMAILYNIADMINKIGFGVVAWMGAKKLPKPSQLLSETNTVLQPLRRVASAASSPKGCWTPTGPRTKGANSLSALILTTEVQTSS